MSNLNPWYYAGIVILGASFSYIVVTAMQFMETSKKESKSSNQGLGGPGSTQFVRHALVALLGIIIGAQLLQYHQDQEELSKKDLSRDMAVARAVAGSTDAKGAAAGPAGFGARPVQRPPRGYLSVADAEKAGAMPAASSALKATPSVVAAEPIVPVASPSISVVPAASSAAVAGIK